MSNNISKDSKSQKKSKLIQEVSSAENLCKLLTELVQQPEWKIETADQFIHSIVNMQKQFQLNTQQQDIVVTAIINCPLKYRSIVHLTIISANYCSENGLRTLDGIIPSISNFLSETLDLKEGIKENILNNFGDKQVIKFIKDKIIIKDSNDKNPIQKEDLFRNLISFLICKGEDSVILNRINLILDVFAGLNHYEKLSAISLDSKIDIKNRVKVVAELFKLKKPNANEAKRLLLYGTQSQILAQQQGQKIAELNKILQEERNLREQKEDEIYQLKQQYQELNQKLLDAKKSLENRHNIIEQEREFYAQLETSSKSKISQQKEATLSNIRNRIEHELNKLEQCFKGSVDSFQENRKIGLKVIKKIREQFIE